MKLLIPVGFVCLFALYLRFCHNRQPAKEPGDELTGTEIDWVPEEETQMN